jgi:AcrR family transcriptional regulator
MPPPRRVQAPSGKALYPVLPPGRGQASPERNALNQRARLQGAMVAAVAEHGYAQTTIAQLVSLAGVSLGTFYKHFADKEQCFLATYDVIATLATERIARAYREPQDWRERLKAGFECFAEIVAVERDASHLVLVDALKVGHRVLEHRDRLVSAFELMFEQSFDDAPTEAQITETTIQAIVTGIRRVAYRRLLRGEPETLSQLTDDLLNWAIGYHASGLTPPQRPPIAHPKRKPRLNETLEQSVIAPLDPETARETHSQRERILHAVVSLASEGGYQALSNPAITARAGVSNETFYEHFSDKENAFLTAFDDAAQRAMQPTAKAFQAAPDWPRAVKAAIAALLEFIVRDHVFARLAFFEILTGGPAATDRAEQSMDTFEVMLKQGYEEHPNVPEVVGEAIIGGLWNVIQHEVGYGRAAQLPQLAPELTYITLTPFLGAKQAARIAGATDSTAKPRP